MHRQDSDNCSTGEHNSERQLGRDSALQCDHWRHGTPLPEDHVATERRRDSVRCSRQCRPVSPRQIAQDHSGSGWQHRQLYVQCQHRAGLDCRHRQADSQRYSTNCHLSLLADRFFKSTPLSRLLRVDLNICPSIHKKFFRFNKICFCSGGWRVLHDSMPYGPVIGQGQGHGAWWRSKSCESGQFQSLSPLPISKRLMVNYDTPRQYLNFNPTIFDIRSRLMSHILQTYGVSASANDFCFLRGVDQQSCMGLIFIFSAFCVCFLVVCFRLS